MMKELNITKNLQKGKLEVDPIMFPLSKKKDIKKDINYILFTRGKIR